MHIAIAVRKHLKLAFPRNERENFEVMGLKLRWYRTGYKGKKDSIRNIRKFFCTSKMSPRRKIGQKYVDVEMW
jgi:hypothetical protein